MRNRRGVFLILLLAALTAATQEAPAPKRDRVRIAILVYDGVYNTEFIAPLDVFNHLGQHSGGRVEVFTIAPRFGTVTTAEGLRIQPDYSFTASPTIDWLVVPSGANYLRDMRDAALIGWIRKTGREAKIVHSNCWGAYLLAAAGLLDGKRATTFPSSVADLAQQFPALQVRRDVLLVDDGGAVTSAGGVSSYHAALYLVEKHFGRDLAATIANGLVVEWDLKRFRHEVVEGAAGR